jgi:RNA polymerase sigma factor (sigma-70 family)
MSDPDSGQLRGPHAQHAPALLRYALAQLPAEDRAALRYACYERRTTAQIATDLGISEEAVKSRLHGALRTLWPRLRELGVAPQ